MPQISEGKHSKDSSDHKQKGGGFFGFLGIKKPSDHTSRSNKSTERADLGFSGIITTPHCQDQIVTKNDLSELGRVSSRNQSRPLEGNSKTTSNPYMTQINNSMADSSSIISRNQLMD
jgi:hypothetical protein